MCEALSHRSVALKDGLIPAVRSKACQRDVSVLTTTVNSSPCVRVHANEEMCAVRYSAVGVVQRC